MKWKRAPSADFALHPDPPAHQVHQPRGDGQPQAGPAVAAGGASCRPARRSRRSPPACRRGCRCPCPATVKCSTTSSSDRDSPRHVQHHFALLGELHGVAHQVDDDLPQAVVVADDQVRHVGVDVIGQLQALAGRRGTANDFIVSPRLSRRSKAVQSRVSLPASILEKSRMSLMTESSASPESRTAMRNSRCWAESWRVEHQLGHADDGVQGRADLVAHVGQEGALGAAGGLGGLLGRLQGLGGLLLLGDVAGDAEACPRSARRRRTAASSCSGPRSRGRRARSPSLPCRPPARRVRRISRSSSRRLLGMLAGEKVEIGLADRACGVGQTEEAAIARLMRMKRLCVSLK